MPGKRCESGREWSDVAQGEGTSRDAERAAEELEDPLPGLLPTHHNARRCVPGVRCVDAGGPLFEVENED